MTIGRRRSDFDDIEGSAEPLRALIADADENVRHDISSIASRLGFQIEEVSDGATAMATLFHGAFDLLLFAESMPRLTALEAIDRVRAEESTR